MRISDQGLALITLSEGCKYTAYRDVGGVLTIGVGHTRSVNAGMTIDYNRAMELLKEDTVDSEQTIDKLIIAPLTQNQFDALCSLVFNCGPAPLKGTLGKLLNKGDYEGAANEFLSWDHVKGKVVEGLRLRRQREAALFRSNILKPATPPASPSRPPVPTAYPVPALAPAPSFLDRMKGWFK